jgi:alpha-L-fucosidase
MFMNQITCTFEVVLIFWIIPFSVNAQNPIIQTEYTADPAQLPLIPAVPQPRPEDSMPMSDLNSFPEMKLDDLPSTPGPFEPTWESIEKNYPGEPAWPREAKFGIWGAS